MFNIINTYNCTLPLATAPRTPQGRFRYYKGNSYIPQVLFHCSQGDFRRPRAGGYPVMLLSIWMPASASMTGQGAQPLKTASTKIGVYLQFSTKGLSASEIIPATKYRRGWRFDKVTKTMADLNSDTSDKVEYFNDIAENAKVVY